MGDSSERNRELDKDPEGARTTQGGGQGSRSGPEGEPLNGPTGERAGAASASAGRRGCWNRFMTKLKLVEEDATPPNWKYIFLMFLSLFTSAFTLTFLFPFLPEMVLSFGYMEEQKGYYVGLVASFVFAGRACGSYFWGWLSDVKGRKVVLLSTIFGNGFFTLLFGFTYNLPMAMILRFLSGLANGTVGTAKTVLYDISDNSNQALGMASISLAWGSGLILGPTIGGLLASPAKRFPHVFSPEGFFGQYPFFLPSFVGFVVAMVGFIVVFFKFNETLHDHDMEMDISASPAEPGAKTPLNLSQRSLNRGYNCKPTVSVEDLREPAFYEYVVQTQSPTLNLPERSGQQSVENYPGGKVEPEANKPMSQTTSPVSGTPSLSQPVPVSDDGKTKLQPVREAEQETAQDVHGQCTDSSGGDIAEVTIEITDCSKNGSSEKPLAKASMPEKTADAEVKKNGKGSAANTSGEEETSTLLHLNGHTERLDNNQVVLAMGNAETNQTAASSRSCCSCWNIKDSKLFKLLREPDIMKSVSLYTVFSFGVIGFDDVFTVWSSTETRLDGLGFNPEEIGMAIGGLSIPMLLLQLKLFPMMTNRFGIIKTFLICNFVLMFTMQTVPLLHLIYDQKVALWCLLALLLIPSKISSSSCFAATSLLVNNSVSPKDAGTVNGIAMTATAVARTLAPTVAGSLYAWTMGAHLGPPFDVSFAFFFLGLISFGTLIGGVFMPTRLNSQRKSSDTPRQTRAA